MKDKNTGRCFFRVDIDESLHDAVLALSEESGVPISVVMRRALENWVVTGAVPARVVPAQRAPADSQEGEHGIIASTIRLKDQP